MNDKRRITTNDKQHMTQITCQTLVRGRYGNDASDAILRRTPNIIWVIFIYLPYMDVREF